MSSVLRGANSVCISDAEPEEGERRNDHRFKYYRCGYTNFLVLSLT